MREFGLTPRMREENFSNLWNGKNNDIYQFLFFFSFSFVSRNFSLFKMTVPIIKHLQGHPDCVEIVSVQSEILFRYGNFGLLSPENFHRVVYVVGQSRFTTLQPSRRGPNCSKTWRRPITWLKLVSHLDKLLPSGKQFIKLIQDSQKSGEKVAWTAQHPH